MKHAKALALSFLLLSCTRLPAASQPTGSGASGSSSGSAVPEEIGLLSVRLAPLSESAFCLYGGWVCPGGESVPLLRCSPDAGASFFDVPLARERCVFMEDALISQDGSTLWISCNSPEGAPYILRSTDQGRSFTSSDPLVPRGELVAWSFISNKSGLAVIATDAADGAQGSRAAYIERSSSDGGSTWQTVFEIPEEAAAAFDPDLEVGPRPPQPKSEHFFLSRTPGADGGPAYLLKNALGQQLSLISWGDIPQTCPAFSPTPPPDSDPLLPPGLITQGETP